MSAAKKSEVSFEDLITRASEIVSKLSGNKFGKKQEFMVETRLKKRMLDLKIDTPDEYLHYLNKHLESESGKLVSLLTTHHTFFFREFTHFEYLLKLLPQIVKDAKSRGDKCIKIWSAACSRGHEVYSLSMFLSTYLANFDPSMRYEIWGSDIDPESVAFAENGVYHRNEIKEIPMNFLANNWAKGTGAIADYVKAKKTITDPCSFFVANLLDLPEKVRGMKFDVIFCRNVLIYFERDQIEQIANSLKTYLTEYGVLISGVSESLSSYKLGFESVGPSVYIKPRAAESTNFERKLNKTKVDSNRPIASTKDSIAVDLPRLPNPLKVVCVDDSNSIIVLMKKILSQGDFEIVGTAKDGKEAEEIVKKSGAHVMTLDIHMPEMTGVEYLKKNFTKSHIPVVMVSSVSRDDSKLAMDALNSGASDFVEKPALNNIEERGEEIKAKLKMAYLNSQFTNKPRASVDKEFSADIKIDEVDKALRISFASYSNIDKLSNFIKEFQKEEPPLVVFFEGQNNLLDAIKIELERKGHKNVIILDELNALKANTIYLADTNNLFEKLCAQEKLRKTSALFFGDSSKGTKEKILSWSGCHLLVEDVGITDSELIDIANDHVSSTSFYYLSTLYLGGK